MPKPDERRMAMHIKLEEDRKELMLHSIKGFYADSFDEELSDFKALKILEFFVSELGPPVYNQAIRDARAFVQEKLEDLEGDFYEPDSPYAI